MFLQKKIRIFLFYEFLFWHVGCGFPVWWSIKASWKFSGGPSKKMLEMRRLYKERVVYDDLHDKTWP